MKLLTRWVINAGTLLLLAYYLPGMEVSGWYAALITAFVLGLVNAVLKPILVILTLPVNILTLGLFTFVINALLFWFVASFIKGFDVAGFMPAFWGALILSVVSWIVSGLLKK
ncbi:MAG: phage holin family protein [Candidatus Magasanikbacteria bacterium]|jgi:putative membrane protein|nr:phage holin family protein [Candidatus Magasanikbacteria bacterium]MBT4314769.1 phage holin family protein [Candidatus Magasanikbacteria bacterium]MBT4547546.1 phage holin family protein [Candidatus Magasanikbacteria bacterium]MBT6819388.1 phage holin family protein [Candidatus Magasanikbacteria bacterium]